MTPEFGYYTALICVSTGMMVFCALLSSGSRALSTPQRRMMFVPFLHRDGDCFPRMGRRGDRRTADGVSHV